MAMQVSPLSMGSAPATAQEHFQEKRAPAPAELKAAAEHAEAALPGGDKSKAPEIKQATEALERVSLAFDRRLKFEIDRESNQILIKVIDNETDKVIKVLPPEELQRLHSRIQETLGFLFDAKV